MRISDEHEEFSRRLKEALSAVGERIDSPTTLARAFNRRYGGRPISVHAARKWLYGEAIPGQDKMRVLAGWLGRTSEWLRFGGDAVVSLRVNDTTIPPMDFNLMRAIAALSGPHQDVVRDLVKSLGHAEQLD